MTAYIIFVYKENSYLKVKMLKFLSNVSRCTTFRLIGLYYHDYNYNYVDDGDDKKQRIK